MQSNLVGQKLGRYVIREMLGMGGMGAVYRAYQDDLKREVALKVISPMFAAQEDLVARFIREAQTAAGLEHAHIVPIYDYGVIANQLYIVMRMLTGGTLSDRIDAARKSGKLPSPAECASLLEQLAGALDYAHGRGVIHRDIKPGNIMFDNHGDAFLVDFGIAKAGDSTNLTRGSSVIGSPSYMAPEQWRGENATSGTDQYALAVVIYTMVTGKLPFEAETPYAVMQLHVNTPPPSPITHRADLSPAVGVVLEKALAKDVNERYPTMRAFAQAFRNAVGEQRTSMETGFFTRPIDRTMKTAILPGGSGSQSGARSQSMSQTLRQQRVGLAVGLGAGLVIAVIVGVLLLMQSTANSDVIATQTALQSTMIGLAAETSTAEDPDATSTPDGGVIQILATQTEAAEATASGEPAVTDEVTIDATEETTQVALLASDVPLDTPSPSLEPTETFTPSPTITLTPSQTPTSTLSPREITGTAAAERALAAASTATEGVVLTGTARANLSETATEIAFSTAIGLTANAAARETLAAAEIATQSAIGTNAAATFQSEDRETQQAIDVAATLDSIVGATRSILNTQAAATADARQATVDALEAQVSATAAARLATEAAFDAQTQTQAAINETATQVAIVTQAAFDQQQTAQAETATQEAQQTQSAATATREAEIAEINATLAAVQAQQTQAMLQSTRDLASINQTATAAQVNGTVQALNARATALRQTATQRAQSTPQPTATFRATALPSPTPFPIATPGSRGQDSVPGIFSPNETSELRVLTTTNDGFITASYVDSVPLKDLYVEMIFETPDTSGYWDIGIAVREQDDDANSELRFYIDSFGNWTYGTGTEREATGTYSRASFNSNGGAINRMTLVAFDTTGIALLNGEVIAVMDFSPIQAAGNIFLGSEFSSGSDVGVDVRIRGVTVGALDVAYGPESGQLVHEASDTSAETVRTGNLTPISFVAKAVFNVPYALSTGSWDVGFDFHRQETEVFDRILLDGSRDGWYLYRFENEFELLGSGTLAGLRTETSQTNEIILIAVRDRGYLIVNGRYETEFDVPDDSVGGFIEIGTGFFTGNEIDGESTIFDDFTVWTFSDQP